jgi:hypothetical protein
MKKAKIKTKMICFGHTFGKDRVCETCGMDERTFHATGYKKSWTFEAITGKEMEKIGAINRYSCQRCGAAKHAINLSMGTTPFLIACELCNDYQQSNFYRIAPNLRGLGVEYCFYRPTKEKFLTLSEDVQDHVLKGGLLFGKLADITRLPPEQDYKGINPDAFLVHLKEVFLK